MSASCGIALAIAFAESPGWHGPVPFMGKLPGDAMAMDRLEGAEFEAGLQNLRRFAEGQSS